MMDLTLTGMGNRFVALFCAVLLAAVSCTKVRSYDVPVVEDYGITIISASIEPLDIEGLGKLDGHDWTPTDSLGVYGSERGENVAYVPFSDGSLNRFCGDIVKGDIMLYYPYRKDGCNAARDNRMPLPAEVSYRDNASDFIFSNLTFVTGGDTDNFSFPFPLSLVKMTLALDLTELAKVSVTVSNVSQGYDEYLCGDMALDSRQPYLKNPGKTLEISGIGGKSVGEKAPLDLWFALPEGKYENFIVGFEMSSGESVVQLCKGPLQTKKRCLTTCKVVEYKPEYSLGGYGSEEGGFKE